MSRIPASVTVTDILATRDEASASTSGFPNSRFARYDSVQEAKAAWTQALYAGRIGLPGSRNMENVHNSSSTPHTTLIDKISAHVPLSTSTNPKQNPSDQTYWVVLKGRLPGDYVRR